MSAARSLNRGAESRPIEGISTQQTAATIGDNQGLQGSPLSKIATCADQASKQQEKNIFRLKSRVVKGCGHPVHDTKARARGLRGKVNADEPHLQCLGCPKERPERRS